MHLLGFDHQTEEEYKFVVEKQNEVLEFLGVKTKWVSIRKRI